jgi:excisionase family DNA binding protein
VALTEGIPVPKKKSPPTNSQAALDKYLTVNDVAAMLGVSDQLVHKLLRERRLPHSRIGRRIIIRLRDVEALLEESRCD